MAKAPKNIENEAFPQLQEIIAPGCLADVLHTRLGPRFTSGELQIRDLTIHRMYYKPGPEGGCRFNFEMKVHPKGEQLFFGHVLPAATAVAQYAIAQAADWVEPHFGPPTLFIPEWNLIIWAYPNDPHLIGLPTLTSPSRVLAMMQQTPERFGIPAGRTAKAVNGRLIKYVPGKRCSYMFQVTLNKGKHIVYAKAYRPDAGTDAANIWQQVWCSPASQSGRLHIPQPYSYDDQLHILWQESLPGRPLSKLSSNVALPIIAAPIARQLAAFHALGLELPTHIDLGDELGNLEKSAEAVSKGLPHIAQRVTALHQQLLAATYQMDAGVLATLHGSFKFSHIFAHDENVALIDVDGANHGDPAYDLGRFMAHVRGMEGVGKISAEVAQQTIDNFWAAYQSASSLSVSLERVMWYTASLLITSHLYKIVKRIRPRRLGQLLTLAEQACPEPMPMA